MSLRSKLKRSKPVFARQESNRRLRLRKSSYRAPDGHHSKQRRKGWGKKRMPCIGYGNPVIIRSLHSSGLKECSVSKISELAGLDKNISGVRLRSGIGLRKKVEIAKECSKKGLRIFNFNIDKFLENFDLDVKRRNAERKEFIKKRSDKLKIKAEKKETTVKKKEDISKLEVQEGSKERVKSQTKAETVKGPSKGLRSNV